MKKENNDRNAFWLDLGPGAAWGGTRAQGDYDGDAAPDGIRRGFAGTENGTVYEPPRAGRAQAENGADAARPDAPKAEPQPGVQVPDVSTANVPAEMPPAPPEGWPGL
jgi:hypothetical protein